MIRPAQILLFLTLIFPILFGGASRESKESKMVLIPAGEFLMGSQEGQGRKEEHPRHKVFLDAFYIDIHETTGRDFEEFLAENPKAHPTITGWYGRKVRPDMADRPVFGLQWKRCKQYCAWSGKRMLTEAEWERAAAGTNNRKFPWGNEPPTIERANFNHCCHVMRGLAHEPVGRIALGKTPEGVYDMAGNVAEWVHDWYDKNYYKKSPYKNPPGAATGEYHVVRGGAWNSFSGYLRSASRYGRNDGQDFYGVGCRCAKSAETASK